MKVALKPQREVKIRATANFILRKEKITGKIASKFIGQVMSSLLAVPLARARIRRMQHSFLKTCPTYKEFWRSFVLSDEIKLELRFWKDLPDGTCLPIKKPRHAMQMTTDGM